MCMLIKLRGRNLFLVGAVRCDMIQFICYLRRFFPAPRQDLLNTTSDRSTLQRPQNRRFHYGIYSLSTSIPSH